MPSDDPRIRMALEALARPVAEFRALLGGALTHAEAMLAAGSADVPARAAQSRVELGWFAEGRIRPERFAALLAPGARREPAAQAALARSVALLQGALDRGESLFLAEVPPGGELGAAADALLAEAGSAFGAVRLAELIRCERYEPHAHDGLLATLPFKSWNRAQRRLAPPLVIAVEGADLHPAALADFCDGRAKFVLVVRGPSAPAALVRLITPGTFVLQTASAAGLDRFVAYEGPAVAALVPEAAARFLHDPAGGKESWQRISILELPEPPRRALGGASAWQMAEDLRQLAALARTPFSVPVPDARAGAAALGESDAVDRLAAWLLAQSNPPAL